MRIQENTQDLIVVGEDTSKRAKISENKMAKLQYLLTKGLYRDPVTAVIAEWTNNGVDSVVQSGKDPIENPVIVTIGRNDKNQFFFSVEDKGIGLDDRDFEDICMNYLESTKENDNDTIGHFGIGMKSFLSLERSAIFICRKNGMERKYLVYEGAEFVNYDLLSEKPTDEENGVKAELIINNMYEYQQFIKCARIKLAYYDTVALFCDGNLIKNNILRNDLFQISTEADVNSGVMHLCLKDVYYSIDWAALGIPAIPINIALRFDLKSGIMPTPSRESYITNEGTKKLIKDRIQQVCDWFVEKYNETVKEYPDFKSAFYQISNSNPFYTIQISETKHFNVYLNSFLQFDRNVFIKLIKPSVKGMKLIQPELYKNNRGNIFYNYTVAGYISNSRFVSPSNLKGYIPDLFGQWVSNQPIVLVKDVLKGNIREFLKKKYSSGTLFVRRNGYKRNLLTSSLDKDGVVLNDFDSYESLFGLSRILKKVDKKKAQPYIDEWEAVATQCAGYFINEVDCDQTQEYEKWVEKRKQDLRANRIASPKSALNKKQGDVTLGYLADFSNTSRRKCWKKSVYPVANIVKNHYLTVLIDESEKEKAMEIGEALWETTVKFALVGKNERKKLDDFSQFINFQQFMTRDCKPFMRLASALKFEQTISDISTIRAQLPIIEHCIPSLMKDINILEEYKEKYLKARLGEDMKKYILDIAEEKQLFDLSIWDVYKRVQEGIKKYEFISCFKQPYSWETEQIKKYNTVINQMLLFRKMYHDDLPEQIEVTIKK